MGITMEDIEIIKEKPTNETPPTSDVKLFYYYNPTTKYRIISIYNKKYKGYTQISKEQNDILDRKHTIL